MKEHQNEEMEIDLLELFFHLLSKWKVLLLGLIIGAVVAGGVGLGAAIGLGTSMNQTIGNPVHKEETKTCISCGAQMPYTAKFCPECGKSNPEIVCTCGQKLSYGIKFCPQCGKKL